MAKRSKHHQCHSFEDGWTSFYAQMNKTTSPSKLSPEHVQLHLCLRENPKRNWLLLLCPQNTISSKCTKWTFRGNFSLIWKVVTFFSRLFGFVVFFAEWAISKFQISFQEQKPSRNVFKLHAVHGLNLLIVANGWFSWSSKSYSVLLIFFDHFWPRRLFFVFSMVLSLTPFLLHVITIV